MPEGLERTRVQLAKAAYENAGREITQAFSTLNFNTALAAGVLATVLGTIGAGELFGRQPSAPTDGIPDLSVVSNFVLVLSAPLLFRFFLRTMLGYQNLLRFNLIQREAWKYLSGRVSWYAFHFVEDMYGNVENWRSPKTLRSLVISNLEYGYFWIFAALGMPLAWSYYTIWDLSQARTWSLVIVGVAAAWEITVFMTHRRKFFRTLSDDEKQELVRLRTLPPDSPAIQDSEIPPSGPVVEELRGMFLGVRRHYRDRG